jgi:hypothetical protein
MQVTYFNRHENMDSETRFKILDLIKELSYKCECDTFTLENYLYGSFDGYDYSEIVIKSDALAKLTFENVELALKVTDIFAIIEKYPRTKQPNNSNF